ncbi:hypothetical protein KI387_003491, partial [Taxus chinensis]
MSQCLAGQILPVLPIRPIRAFTAQMSRIFGEKVLLFGRSGRFAYSRARMSQTVSRFSSLSAEPAFRPTRPSGPTVLVLQFPVPADPA